MTSPKRAALWIIALLSFAVVCSSVVMAVRADNGPIERTVALGAMPPWQVALDGRAGRLYITGFGAGSASGRIVSVLNDVTGTLLRTDRAGISPEAVAVDEQAARAFVIGNGNGYGVVTALDTRSGAVMRSVRVGERPDAVVVDARAGRVLVLSAYSDNDPTPDRWGLLPGWLRTRLPWLAPQPPPVGVPTGSIRILDAAR